MARSLTAVCHPHNKGCLWCQFGFKSIKQNLEKDFSLVPK
jgi:hypothetical protein